VEESKSYENANHTLNKTEALGLAIIIAGAAVSNPFIAVAGLSALMYGHSRHYHSN